MEVEGLRFEGAFESDATALAELRVEAMRPSLQALGRFDPDRARNRFLDGFTPADTTLVYVGPEMAGFFVLRRRPDHLYLDHLYMRAAFQGRRIGGRIVAALQDEARRAALPIRLLALKRSPANAFYCACGFALVSEDGFDNTYEWRATPSRQTG
ncbi:GNAT family N-acetyltransferase [Salipiger pentaromativorans]|uniref:GNAT family N-acetyltransferase n=1 Tax=Salipiger pentaromativorans TaxID=2943193 RepID=UPI002157FA0D|nr:GNAT family N-acetyltransferase [Salipiger pentaromativorans]